jgi:hypothetical protein
MADVELSVLLKGLGAAYSRLASAPPEGVERFHAIFEILAWVGSIRDRLRQDSRPAPPVLDGLYYVRNLVLHQGADVLKWTLFPGAELGILVLGESSFGSISRHAWVWPPRNQMPAPRSSSGVAEYDTRIAGREVTVVLEPLAAALLKITETGAPQ